MHFDTSRDAVYYFYALKSELFHKLGRLICPVWVTKSIEIVAARPLGPNFSMIY